MSAQSAGPPVQDGIGSSEVAAILGLDTFQSPYDVWHRKVYGPGPDKPNDMMRWGTLLEDVVAQDFADRTGIPLRRILHEGRQRTLRMKGHPLIVARLDRRTLRRPRRVVEVKTSPFGIGFGEAGEYARGREGGPMGLPPRIRVQVYHQLAVTGYGEAIVVVLIGGYQRRDYVVPADPDIQADLVAELEEWWERHVPTRTPPPVDGSAGAQAWLRATFPRESEDMLTATPEQERLIEDLRIAKAEVKVWKGAETLAAQKVAAAIGAHAGMTFPGGRVTYKAHEVTTNEWDLVAKAYRTIVEELAILLDGPEAGAWANWRAQLPPPVTTALENLDAIETLHQRTRVDRPLRATWDKEEQT